MFCEYADGANNSAGLDTIQRVPTLVTAEAAMNTPLDMGVRIEASIVMRAKRVTR